MPGIVVPPNYTSPDVIDRRSGQSPTLGDKFRDLMIKVRDDYQSSIGSNPNAAYTPGLDTQQHPMVQMLVNALGRKQ